LVAVDDVRLEAGFAAGGGGSACVLLNQFL